jgi:porphobilinogen deaminase
MKIGDRMSGALSNVNHWDTWYMAMAEKQALKEIDGDCQTPIGMLSVITNGNIKIIGRNFETMKISVQEGPLREFQEIGSLLGRALI